MIQSLSWSLVYIYIYVNYMWFLRSVLVILKCVIQISAYICLLPPKPISPYFTSSPLQPPPLPIHIPSTVSTTSPAPRPDPLHRPPSSAGHRPAPNPGAPPRRRAHCGGSCRGEDRCLRPQGEDTSPWQAPLGPHGALAAS